MVNKVWTMLGKWIDCFPDIQTNPGCNLNLFSVAHLADEVLVIVEPLADMTAVMISMG